MLASVRDANASGAARRRQRRLRQWLRHERLSVAGSLEGTPKKKRITVGLQPRLRVFAMGKKTREYWHRAVFHRGWAC